MDKYDMNDLKKHFSNIIDEELNKSIEDQDSDLIEECVDLIMELDGTADQFELSESDMTRIKDEIYTKAVQAENKFTRIRISKKSIIAVAMVAVFLAISGTMMATDWTRQVHTDTMDMKPGETTIIDGVEIIESYSSVEFNALEELENYIGYELLYPTYFPKGGKLNKIYFFELEDKRISIPFEYKKIIIRYTINDNIESFYDIEFDNPTECIGSHYCYIFKISDDAYQIGFIYENRLYTFSGNDYNELVKVIESLE